MSDRLPAADRSRQPEAAGGSYFAPLASARYMLLTTFKRQGTPVSVPVRGIVDGDRAYFQAWNRSGHAKRLRRTDVVQVAPCTALGLYSNGPPRYATARRLPDGEASQVAGKLARKYPVQHRYLITWLHRARRWQMVHYELMAHDAPGD